MKLSIIIPVFNEIKTISSTLYRVEEAKLPQDFEREIVIVDDCSTDGTRNSSEKLKKKVIKFFIMRTTVAKVQPYEQVMQHVPVIL
jgi:glycosyltransferase involved in cell wall biosynthesis